MKNIIKSLVIVVAVAAVASVATWAVFSETDEVTGNSIATGTLNIDVREVANKPVSVGNMAPGDEVTGTFDAFNQGSLDAEYYFYISNVSGDNALLNALNIELRWVDENGAVIYTGTLSGIRGDANKHITTDVIWPDRQPCMPAGWTQRIWQKISLPIDTGNSVQGKSLTFDESIYAEQCDGVAGVITP